MKKIISLMLAGLILLSFSACSKADKQYGVKQEETQNTENSKNALPEIMTLDQKMSNYFDISVFDEENYSEIYLGKKFKYDASFDGSVLNLPEAMESLVNSGWKLAEGSDYDENSLIFAKETVYVTFVNEKGAELSALFYNSSNSSVKLLKCNIVKFRIENNYFQNPNDYDGFNVNGITNTTAVTDIIDVLGTPSHFYEVSDDNYYFDYFISKSDRRNKIRTFVNLTEDCISAIEFSYYK